VASYVKSTDFAVKDGLLTGNPNKIIKGTEIDDEYNAIAVAVQTKADLVSPTFTGTPLAPTASQSVNNTQIATTAFAKSAADAAVLAANLGTMATQNASNVAITGGSVTGITDLAVADGGTGASSFTANNVLLGNGTSSFQTVAPGSNGNVLTSNGTTWTSTASTSLSGTVVQTTGSAPYYGARAWANFDGFTGTIRGSGNVSSITRGGDGLYTVNFTTAMANANYSTVLGQSNNVGNVNVGSMGVSPYDANPTTTNVTLRVWTPNVGGGDLGYSNVTIFS
jgi:hypothetical protein